MSLEPGRDLAQYHVLSKIGEGGMGEVYRATDRRLGRDVAIKILPAALAGDPERLARFQREAQVLAALNHPNIAAIYGLELVEGVRFLVLELVEGPDLAERLAQGPLPLEQALDVARQIAEALETAHEQGIVHRDLKPANVKLAPGGKVKILDFGLAKALLYAPADRTDMSRSPTITSLATQDGVILGTAAYMSPEQARGGDVDRRADIWAFGCVLLELLTGRNPFVEKTVSDTLASILRSDPDWKRLPAAVPREVRRLLQRCLDKDPHRRLRDIGEARVAIDRILSGDVEDADDLPVPARAPASGSPRWPVVAAAVVLTAMAVGAVTTWLRPRAPEPHLRRFELVAGGFDAGEDAIPRLSPDGRKVVFLRNDGLWLRWLDRLEPQRLDGTAGASMPAWTSDSGSVVFIADGDLKSVSVTGGGVSTIAFAIGELQGGGGLDVMDDRVVYAKGNEDIREVSLRGGEPRGVVLPDGSTESDFHEPSGLPDGSIVYVVHRLPEGPDTLAVLAGGTPERVLQFSGEFLSDPAYSPTGHLIYHRGGTRAGLWAAPFSLDRHEVTGDSLLITPDGAYPSVSDDGTLLYVRGAADATRQLVWVERDGRVAGVVGPEQAGIAAPALSPDGSRVAVMAPTSEAGNIWIFDVEGGTRTRLTFGKNPDWDPVWMPEGNAVVYWDGQTRSLTSIATDGSGETRRLVKPDLLDSGVPSISPDGKWMAFWARPAGQVQDLMAVDLEGDGEPVPVVATPAIEETPVISPDGGYVAYQSDESGRSEIYVSRFPGGEGKWQVSVDGGIIPHWSPLGNELFYVQGTELKQVEVTLGPAPRFGSPKTLFDAASSGLRIQSDVRYDVSRDGKRFLMVRDRQTDQPTAIVISYDWTAAFEP